MKLKHLVGVTALAAGLACQASAHAAAVFSVDFSTAGPQANTQVYGSTFTSGALSNLGANYLKSQKITVVGGDTLSATGTWLNNSNNASGDLYFGIFLATSGNPSNPTGSPLSFEKVASNPSSPNGKSFSTSQALTWTPVSDASFFLVWYSNAGNSGSAYKTGNTQTTTCPNGNCVDPGPTITPTVPLPGTIALLGLGMLGLGAARKKQA